MKQGHVESVRTRLPFENCFALVGSSIDRALTLRCIDVFHCVVLEKARTMIKFIQQNARSVHVQAI